MTINIRHFEHEIAMISCPACRSNKLKPYVIGQDFHYEIEGNFQTSICSDCCTVFMDPMPTPVDLAALYPDDYYSYQPPQKQNAVHWFLENVMRYPRVTHVPHFDAPGVMLDVGCGAGQYLFNMRERGWTVYGAELSRGAAEAGRKAGLDIRGGELMEAAFEPKMFDFVRSNHSFEHMPNPDAVLQEMRRILKDDGKLFIGIPNFDGAWAKLFTKHWWNFGLPVHTMNYTQKGIKTLLEHNGFRVEKIINSSDYSGFLGSWQIKRNSEKGIFRSDGNIMSNKILRLPVHYVSKILDRFGRGDCIEVIASKS